MSRLVVLAAGLFVFLTAELYPVGAMPDMVTSLGNSESEIGRLITWYAVGVGVATIPLVMLTQRVARRTVIVGTLAALAVSMAGSAFAPSLLVVSLARLLGAAAHGAIFAVVPLAAAALAPRGHEAKSVGTVFLGASLGVVAGPPLVAIISQHFGWRVASGAIAVLAAVIAVVSQLVLPPLQAPASSEQRLSFRMPRAQWWGLAIICSVTILVVFAHNAAYAFIAPILASHGVTSTGYAATLFVYGVAGALTAAIASRFLDQHPLSLAVGALLAMIASLVALALVPGPVIGIAAAISWGGAFGMIPSLMQTRVLAKTPGNNDVATSIYVVAFQVGISLGAFLGSVLILHLKVWQVPLLAAALVALAVPLLVAAIRPSSLDRLAA